MALFEPAQRVYVGYLVGAGLVASLVWFFKLRHRLGLLAFLADPRVWLHRSSLFDVRLMALRALLSTALLGSVLFSATIVAIGLRGGLVSAFGPGLLELPHVVSLLVISVVAFVCEDFARYWAHRLAHRVPELWALHKVHHSAEVLTPFTIYRAHPLDALILRTAAALFIGVGAGASSWFLNTSIGFSEILGVSAPSVLWNALGSNLRHSSVWISYPSWLEKWFISPAQHQIHHSVASEHFDRNFGSVFAVWDRIFGTLFVTGRRTVIEYGLNEKPEYGYSVLLSLVYPLRELVRILSQRVRAWSPRAAPALFHSGDPIRPLLEEHPPTQGGSGPL